MIKKFYFLTFIILFVYPESSAQQLPRTFSQRTYGILNYDFFTPDSIDTLRNYPLILYFHGYSDTAVKKFNWYQGSIQSVNPCFVLAPKCPVSDQNGWGNSWSTHFSPRMALAIELLDTIINNYNIDTNRLYIYGTSMGGFGTFDVLYRRPGKFAASMILCGGGNPQTAEQVAKTPLWIFHGSLDTDVPISYSRDIYNRMIANGAEKVHFKVYPGVYHDMWNNAPYDPAWPDWIFHFAKDSEPFTEKPDSQIVFNCAVRSQGGFDLTWNNVRNPDDRKNKIWHYRIFRNGTFLSAPAYTATTYTDKSPDPGLNVYKIVALNYDFIASDTSAAEGDNTVAVEEQKKMIPDKLMLSRNFPNPFNPSTTIEYSLNKPGKVKLLIYNLIGKVVKVLVDNSQSAGTHSVKWDATDSYGNYASSGVYIYRLETDEKTLQKKMILLR